MKATEQYFPVVLFIILCKVALTFESVDEILKYDIQLKANEQYFFSGVNISIFSTFCVILYYGIVRKLSYKGTTNTCVP